MLTTKYHYHYWIGFASAFLTLCKNNDPEYERQSYGMAYYALLDDHRMYTEGASLLVIPMVCQCLPNSNFRTLLLCRYETQNILLSTLLPLLLLILLFVLFSKIPFQPSIPPSNMGR